MAAYGCRQADAPNGSSDNDELSHTEPKTIQCQSQSHSRKKKPSIVHYYATSSTVCGIDDDDDDDGG